MLLRQHLRKQNVRSVYHQYDAFLNQHFSEAAIVVVVYFQLHRKMCKTISDVQMAKI